MKTVAERVLAGVMWLDMVAPGWRERVNPAYLNMRQPDLCVIGQAIGNYWDAKRHYGLTDADMAAMGFQAKGNPHAPSGLSDMDYGALEAAWKVVLSS